MPQTTKAALPKWEEIRTMEQLLAELGEDWRPGPTGHGCHVVHKDGIVAVTRHSDRPAFAAWSMGNSIGLCQEAPEPKEAVARLAQHGYGVLRDAFALQRRLVLGGQTLLHALGRLTELVQAVDDMETAGCIRLESFAGAHYSHVRHQLLDLVPRSSTPTEASTPAEIPSS